MTGGKLFESEEVKAAPGGLMITRHQKNNLSKQQQAFNKLVKKIENLRFELEHINKSLNSKLDFYGKHIYPLEQQINELNKEATKLLYGFFKNKKLLSEKDRATLRKIIVAGMEVIIQFEKGEPDEELKHIFKAVEGISYEDALAEEFGNMKYAMESMFEDFGFDMNFDDVHSKMTPEEIIKKTMEMEEKLKQQAEEKKQK